MADADPSAPPLTPLRTTERIRQRVIEAVLGQSGLNHAALIAEVRRRFGSLDVSEGALVREPVIEAAAPFLTGEKRFGDLAGSLLHPDVIRAIGSESAGGYRFPPEAKPYIHQIEAWQHLTAPEPRSVLVSSGTGSGKTECFLMPLLHDLAIEAEQKGRLSGVRALALYPLNALIASQEERLRAWTAPFGGKLRFGLYNGLMPERLRATEGSLEQVLDRHILRRDPPPILVTNVTMLEYMTVRRVDRPLLENSRGLLRWIILDEAHGYIGSSAAEIALLIRRVLLAFGVSAEQVRFVATSATIGSGKGRDVTDALRRFLRDLSGADQSRVHVVLGEREPLELPVENGPLALDSADLRDRTVLERNPAVKAFLHAAEREPLSLAEVDAMLAPAGLPAEQIVDAIAADLGKGPILPLRVHSFLRAVPGLWSCINPACADAPRDWPFGAVSVQRIEQCNCCAGPVFEILSCRECGEPYLDSVERDRRLEPRIRLADQDEFAAASDHEEVPVDSEDEAADHGDDQLSEDVSRIIGTRRMRGSGAIHVEPLTGIVHDRAGPDLLELRVHDGQQCGHCGAVDSRNGGAMLRPFRFGAPFLIGNAAPVLLDGVPPRETEMKIANRPPADGRQILSFTDSRQGTARFAANLQTSSERNFVRGFIYHSVQGSMAVDPSSPDAIKLADDIAALEPIAQKEGVIAAMVAAKKDELAALRRPSTSGLPWDDVRASLAAQPEVFRWIREVWRYRDERFNKSETAFAEFLMLRELARRPRRANSLETMGMARLRFDAIDRLGDNHVPPALVALGHDASAWRDFLYLLIDMSVRANLAFRVTREDLHWLIRDGRTKVLIAPGEQPQDRRDQRWPMAGTGPGVGNVVLILEKIMGLDRTEPRDRAAINAILSTAWDQLLPLFSQAGSADYALNFTAARIAPVTDAWACPVTRKILPAVAFGLSPYGHREGLTVADMPASPVAMPQLRHPFPRVTQLDSVRDWLDIDPVVGQLRAIGVWTDIHDRSALLTPYLRAAEHSAQQPAPRLRRFESEFKAGQINILNCSTTMEMGVDIGSVSAVMMTNVPPALANYRQRVGRAGRRRQGYASSLTYTRDTPLDRETFRDPQAYLGRSTNAPQVKLDSRRIVQRHVNALLLARWFVGEGGEVMKTRIGDFFGCTAEIGAGRAEASPASLCLAWLDAPSTRDALRAEVRQLTAGTILEGDRTVHAAARHALEDARAGFLLEWDGLQSQAQGLAGDKAAAAGLGYQLQRLCGENLLKELAIRSVLPGHGFPTGVVPFINSDTPAKDDDNEGDGARGRRRSFPSRNLDIAIRDYAPGAEVVVDGLVYKSAGVTLNWTRPADDVAARQIQNIKTFWTCAACGAADCGHGAPEHCPNCHADISIGVRRFLEPAGFTVDMHTEPHADTDKVHYVEPEREQIVARGAAWSNCANPELGRLRSSSEGLVFYSSMGATRGGYWVCLECGRAEPALDDSDRPLAGHKPLRGTPRNADGLCPGNERAFKILQPLALGHETITDVAELQPAGLAAPGAAWAMVSALREALAKRLGVEAGEMGMSVRPARSVLSSPTHSLFLYDRNSGGAGFSPQAVPLYEALLADCENILDCKEKGCETGCSACVLTADLFKQQENVDRKGALALVRKYRAGLAAPAKEDLATVEAVFSRMMADEIVARVGGGDRIATIWPRLSVDIAEFSSLNFVGFARSISDKGAALHVVVSDEWLNNLDPAARLALRDAALARPFELFAGAAPNYANGASALAATGLSTPTFWASRDPNAGQLGENWGSVFEAPIVRFSSPGLPVFPKVDLAKLLPASGTRYLEIGRELDGVIAGFGERFVRHIRRELDNVGMESIGSLVRLHYSDRYLHAPLPVRLAFETVSVLRDTLGGKGMVVPVSIVTDRLRSSDRQPRAPDHNWQWPEDRNLVFARLADIMNFDLSVDERGAPHGRVLTIEGEKASIRMILDQGFGNWRTPRFATFDFGLSADTQTEKLMQLSATLETRGTSYIVITA